MNLPPSSCIACRQFQVDHLLTTPRMPLSNRFCRPGEGFPPHFSLKMGVCASCGLLQLTDAPSAETVRPVGMPVLYNEPESHLDEMVEMLCTLEGINVTSRFLGLTYKEESTLKRLRDRGYSGTLSCESRKDFGISDPAAGLETVQQVISSGSCKDALQTYQPVDVVIMRQILEHAHDPLQLLTEIKNTLRPRYVVVEVPDCGKAVSLFDYTTIWEEHVSYFTPASLQNLCSKAGFAVVSLTVFQLPYEDSIIAILKEGNGEVFTHDVTGEIAQCKCFGDSFPMHQEKVRAVLERLAAKGCSLLGAGHLATAFVHLHGIQPLIRAVFDDSPEKIERQFPGTALQIRPSGDLIASEFKTCLLSVNPSSEQKVIGRFAEFQKGGGEFLSIFPVSPHYLHLTHGTR